MTKEIFEALALIEKFAYKNVAKSDYKKLKGAIELVEDFIATKNNQK